MKMRVRDAHASIIGDKTVQEMPSGGLDILGVDDRVLFSIMLQGDNELHLDSGGHVKAASDGRMLDDRFVIVPKAANCVVIRKLDHDI